MEELLEYREKMLARWAEISSDLQQVCAQWKPQSTRDAIGDGGWSLHQTVAHLRDVEREAIFPRIKKMTEEERPALENFDQDAWMAAHYRLEEPLEEILAEYAHIREREIAFLRTQPVTVWSRMGWHIWHGERTLQWMVEHSLAHAEEHLAELRAALRKE